jgi:hypothetical protein
LRGQIMIHPKAGDGGQPAWLIPSRQIFDFASFGPWKMTA